MKNKNQVCIKCKTPLPLINFGKDSKGKYRKVCKICYDISSMRVKKKKAFKDIEVGSEGFNNINETALYC